MADISINQNTDTAENSTATAKQLLQQAWAANIDSQTATQLSGLAQVRQARINQLQRQVVSLTAQSGASDPRVATLQSSIQSQQSLAARLGVVRDQSSTPAPTVPANGWVIYGRVRDENLEPMAKLTVFPVNGQKEWLRDYGYAFTDATGYFIISHTPAASVDKDRAAAALSVYLEVINQQRQPLYIDSSAFTINTGAAEYRDIVLSGDTSLGRPPTGASAAPPATS